MAPLPQQPPATDAANGVTAAEGGDAAAANPPSSSRLATSIHAPRQAAPRSRRATAIAWAGRVGWTGKGVLYALIGGIACRSALAPPTPPGAEQRLGSSSPEGAFILLGASGPNGIGLGLLLVMAAALLLYSAWRFAEAATGQGYDAAHSRAKNFFKYRVSPAVSGAVYCSYEAFLVAAMHAVASSSNASHAEAQLTAAGEKRANGWPASWRYSTAGRAGLGLVGAAFLIATAIQLQGVLTSAWHSDYRRARRGTAAHKALLFVFTLGHLGFMGRAGAFLAMAVLFFKDAGGQEAPHEGSMVANALAQLDSRGLSAVLFIVGFLLIIYGTFAVASAAARVFPTPPPSGVPASAAALAARDASHGSGGGSKSTEGAAPGGGAADKGQELAFLSGDDIEAAKP